MAKKKQAAEKAEPVPQASAQERAAAVKRLVSELNARPDAQERIVSDALPTLSRVFNIDIPEIDMGIREEVSAAAPGPMTQLRRIDPATLTNADAGQSAKVGAPSGGIEAQTTLAVGKALGKTEGKPLDRGQKVAPKKGASKAAAAEKAEANRAKAAGKKPAVKAKK